MYKIIGTSPDGKKKFVGATGFYSKEKAQEKISSGYIKKYLMPEFKDYSFEVVEE